MLKIVTEDIESEVFRLKKLIEDYEENFVKLFMELSDASFLWKEDAHAKAFFNDLKYEKATEQEYYLSLLKMYEVFEYISKKYQSIGKKIAVNIEERDNILAKFNTCIEQASDIMSHYKSLDTSFCPQEKQLINNQIIRLKNLIIKYRNTKTKVKNLIDRIIDIEKEVRNKMSKFSIAKVDELSIKNYLPEE